MLPGPTRPELPRSLFSAAVAVGAAVDVMLTVVSWRNVAVAKTMTVAVEAVLTAVHPAPNWGHQGPAMAMNIVVTTVETIVRAEHGRATDPAGEVHTGQALHFQPQQWTCGAHLRVDGASGPGEVPGELLIAPWSLIRQPPIPKSNPKF